MSYSVVFEYTAQVTGYEGVRTWTCFENKEQFQKYYTEEMLQREKVVAQGISEEECIQLTRQTPLSCYAAAAVQAAIDPESGKINMDILEMELNNVIMAQVMAKTKK